MADDNPRIRVRIVKKPVHPVFWHFAVACFLGALATDVTYWQTAEMMWTNFSAWLLAAGMVLGVVAAILCLFDLITGRLVAINRVTWPYILGNALTLILGFFNCLIHSRDAWTSVVPTGLALSIATAVVLIVFGLAGRATSYRREMVIV